MNLKFRALPGPEVRFADIATDLPEPRLNQAARRRTLRVR